MYICVSESSLGLAPMKAVNATTMTMQLTGWFPKRNLGLGLGKGELVWVYCSQSLQCVEV